MMPAVQTRKIARGQNYYRMLADGWKVCRTCAAMVKSDTLLCPLCSKKFKTRSAERSAGEVLEAMQQIIPRADRHESQKRYGLAYWHRNSGRLNFLRNMRRAKEPVLP